MDQKKVEREAKAAFSKANPELQRKACHGCKASQSARKAWINGYVTETMKYADQ